MLGVLEGYKVKVLRGILKCRHDFHAGCTKKWLEVKNTCPMCKSTTA
jgi:E3 ubiquitin-protein ligase RNF38/44